MRAELNGRTAIALAALLAGCWAILADASSCSTCTEPNGRGIYVRGGAHYCIDHYEFREGREIIHRFCPEALVETPSFHTRVSLVGRSFIGPHFGVVESPLESSSAVYALYDNQPVTLTGVESSSSGLVFSYADNDEQREVTGQDLERLMLRIQIGSGSYHLNFKEQATSPYGYAVKWKPVSEAIFHRPLCSDTTNTTLLPSKRVGGTTGVVTDKANAITISCESGAISTCMRWGYDPNRPELSEKGNDLLSACIQAKRAAYFGGPTSYTQDGKAISLSDYMAIKNEPIEADALEAIWGPTGAHCLNAHNRRAPEVSLPAGWEGMIPKCDEVGGDWWSTGILATGKAP